MKDLELRKNLLAEFLEIEADEITEQPYNDFSFEVSPSTRKNGESPAYYIELVEKMKDGIFEKFDLDYGIMPSWEELILSLCDNDETMEVVNLKHMNFAYSHFYESVSKYWDAKLTPVGSIHYFANSFYHLFCGALDSKEWHIVTLRKAWNNEELEDTRESYPVNSGEYLVLTDEEATERAEEYCKQTFEDISMSDIPEDSFLRNYIDLDRAATDAVNIDGRGHSLSGYDGSEEEIESDETGETFYIYRSG